MKMFVCVSVCVVGLNAVVSVCVVGVCMFGGGEEDYSIGNKAAVAV